MSNSYGTLFKISTFGESHGHSIGVVIDGCPAGLTIDDTFKILSGIFENKTTGAPLAIVIENQDQRSKDYSHLENTFRPSHADYTYEAKYGTRDHRGGGRSSARETAARVAAGAIAKLFLKHQGVEIAGFVSQV